MRRLHKMLVKSRARRGRMRQDEERRSKQVAERAEAMRERTQTYVTE